MNIFAMAVKMGINKKVVKGRSRKRPYIMKYPTRIENEYAKSLKDMVAKWKELYKEKVAPYLLSLAIQHNMMNSRLHTDAVADDINALIESLKIDINSATTPITSQVKNIGSQVANVNSVEWQKTVQSVMGIPPIYDEPWLDTQISSFAQQNSTLIKNLASQTANDIEVIIHNGLQQGLRVEQINQQILGTNLTPGKFNSVNTRAELIARDQVSKLNGQISELRQTDLGIKRYIWHTSMDERVRAKHRAMEGILCTWEDPTIYSLDDGKTWIPRTLQMVHLHPGQDYNCRCWAEANYGGSGLEDLFEGL